MTPEQFKASRDQLGMSAAELAVALGVNRTTVQRYERGLVAVPRATELALKALMGEAATSSTPQAAE
jgi:predicted transcriptional regulator